MSTPPAPIGRNPRLLDEATLTVMIADGDIDTVVVAFTDMQGRLQGKRLHAEYFLDEVLGARHRGLQLPAGRRRGHEHRRPATPSRPGRRGYGDMLFVLDTDTMRLLPHLPGTAMVQCDLAWLDGSAGRPVAAPDPAAVRSIARRRPGYTALAGTELEFIVFDDTYEQAWDADYRDLTPANQYNVDYSILGTTRVEPLLRDIRNTMYAAGMTVESAKGECNFGQHEIAFRYAEALTTADNHTVYKNGAKEIADAHGRSLTFMAKFDEREGNSCHIHLSLRGRDGSLVFWAEGRRADRRLRPLRRRRAGDDARVHPALRAERQLLQAIRRRIVRADRPSPGAATTGPARSGSSATAPSARIENRVPGGDVNPYLALAGMIAGGLHGIEQRAPAPRRADRQRLRVRRRAGAPHAARGPGRVRRIGDRRIRVR